MRTSTFRAGTTERSREAALRPTAHPLRGNARAYVGRALGREWGARWVAHGLRVLVFFAAGLTLGTLALALVS